jgi:hypothetical protein
MTACPACEWFLSISCYDKPAQCFPAHAHPGSARKQITLAASQLTPACTPSLPTADLCADVTCSASGQCKDAGICNPDTGVCAAETTSEDGGVCIDGSSNTGSCVSGSCQSICPAGYGGATCTQCVAGKFSLGGSVMDPNHACEDCASDLWSSAGASTCTDLCAAADCSPTDQCKLDASCDRTTGTCGSYPDAPDSTACTLANNTAGTCRTGACVALCPPGTGGPNCDACAVGFYSLGGNLTTPRPACTSCTSLKTTVGTGSTTASACTVTICAAGRGGSSCAPCALGWYSVGGSKTSPKKTCDQCTTGTTTPTTGGTSSGSCSVSICAAGRGGSSCTTCAQGFFSTGGSPTNPKPACVQCPAAKTTPTTGAPSLASCSVSICAAGKAGASCTTCARGTYSVGGTLTNPAASCQACPGGKSTNATGAIAASSCNIQVCSAGQGGYNCAACIKGYYNSAGTQSNPQPACQKCGAGTTTWTSGLSSCHTDLCASSPCTGSTCKLAGNCTMTSTTAHACSLKANMADGTTCSATVGGQSVSGACHIGLCGECMPSGMVVPPLLGINVLG